MADKELAKALLKLDLSRPPDSDDDQAKTRRVLDRDRFRVKLFGVVMILCWVGAAVILYWCMFSLIGMYSEVQAEGRQADPVFTAVYEFLLMLAASIEGIIFALLFTFLFMWMSRRATLRQINANLALISSQLNKQTNGS